MAKYSASLCTHKQPLNAKPNLIANITNENNKHKYNKRHTNGC